LAGKCDRRVRRSTNSYRRLPHASVVPEAESHPASIADGNAGASAANCREEW
jgi:hypothetical protein